MIAVARGTTRREPQPPTTPPPAQPVADRSLAQAILDERLARGELGVAEHTERSRALRER